MDVVEAYRTIIPPESAARACVLFERHRPHVIVFTSSSAVNNLFELLPADELERNLGGIKMAAIGPITSRTLRERGLTVEIEPSEYTVPALVRSIVETLGKSQPENR